MPYCIGCCYTRSRWYGAERGVLSHLQAVLFYTQAIGTLSMPSTVQIVDRGCALLGYAPIGPVAFVVLATRVRPAATLPGGHLVRLVADSKWLHVPLQVGAECYSWRHVQQQADSLA